jgi:hypothetical protein
VVRLQIINLLLEQQCPEVFAEEFDAVEVGLGAGFVCGEAGEGEVLGEWVDGGRRGGGDGHTYRSTSPCPTR